MFIELPPGNYKAEGLVSISFENGKVVETFKGKISKGPYKGHRLEWEKRHKQKKVEQNGD